MTGRDLIIYISQNHLEEEPISKNEKFLGFLDEKEAAVKFNVGVETIKAGFRYGILDGVKIGGVVYILPDTDNPFKHDKKETTDV